MSFQSPLTGHKRDIVYADCTGSGEPDPEIERSLALHVLPYYANTHSDAFNANMMTALIERSRFSIKNDCLYPTEHDEYAVVFTGQGMTGAARHFAHLLSVPEFPVRRIIYTILEHLSNSTLWESVFEDATVNVVGVTRDPTKIDLNDMDVCLNNALSTIPSSSTLLVAFTACSNVIGCMQPVHKINDLIESYRTASLERNVRIITCVDCAACAPYFPLRSFCTNIDGIVLSPHKFKGGQSTPGVLLVRKSIVDTSRIPFFPGGGTVWYKDKCNQNHFLTSIEHREEGGTPNIIGVIRTGLLFERKHMHQAYITQRTYEIVQHVDTFFLERPALLNKLRMFVRLGKYQKYRLPIYSFRVRNVHPGLFVKVFSDKYGIQARSGVTCCHLLADHLSGLTPPEREKIKKGCGTPKKYGWVRISFYYGNDTTHINTVLHALEHLVPLIPEYREFYEYSCEHNAWTHKTRDVKTIDIQQHVELLFKSV